MDKIKKRLVTVKRQSNSVPKSDSRMRDVLLSSTPNNMRRSFPTRLAPQKPSAPLDPMRDFYYANTYTEDVQKARNMQNNVHFDLKPFSAYIRASIDHIGKSTAEGADVVIVDFVYGC